MNDMNILVIGATGETGRRVVLEGLQKEHNVTAFVRNPSRIRINDANLMVAQGDVLDYASIEAAVKGQDAVISALGSRSLMKDNVVSIGTKNVITAMERQGVKRFICMTSLGVGDSKGQLGPLYNFIIIPLLLKSAFEEKEVQEQYIKQSNLDWTIVRPTTLVDIVHFSHCRVWVGPPEVLLRGWITRDDVAQLMLKELTRTTHIRKAVGISY